MRVIIEFEVPGSGDDSAQGAEIEAVLLPLARRIGRAAYVFAENWKDHPGNVRAADGTIVGAWRAEVT